MKGTGRGTSYYVCLSARCLVNTDHAKVLLFWLPRGLFRQTGKGIDGVPGRTDVKELRCRSEGMPKAVLLFPLSHLIQSSVCGSEDRDAVGMKNCDQQSRSAKSHETTSVYLLNRQLLFGES